MRSKLFERVKYIASKIAGSQAILSEQLGINRRTFEGYFKEDREKNLWPLLPQILTLYPHIQRNWLYFGEGEPCIHDVNLDYISTVFCADDVKICLDDVELPQRLSHDGGACASFCQKNGIRPVPMVGLASCGTEGWNKVTTISVSASPIVLGQNSIAVIAAGESMVPAGIASGQICYCDPDQVPLEGDAVYLLRRDNKATVKLYLGSTEKDGHIRLKGWHRPNASGEIENFFIELPESEVMTMAPVMYVRRRL